MNENDELLNIRPIQPSSQDAFEDNSDFSNKLKLFSLITLKIIISSIALYLSWQCNSNVSLPLKILYGIITVILAEFYIIYYAIYRLYMGNKCS